MDADVVALSIDSAQRMFEAHFALAGTYGPDATWSPDRWAPVADLGLPLAFADAERGGLGLDTAEAAPLLRLTGSHALRLPLAETMVANLLLGRARLALTDGVATLGTGKVEITPEGGTYRVTAQLARAPWARHADRIVVATGEHIASVSLAGASVEPETNLAHEPRDTLSLDLLVGAGDVAALPAGFDPFAAGAAMRTIQISGAIERILDLTIAHANERVQFGRPLAKFQAIQQDLARLAGQAAAAGAAADMAAQCLAGRGSHLSLAAAKVRAAEAAGIAAGIAHQIHGAMGFTEEHPLHRLTSAILAWREEFGGQPYWSRVVADAAFAAGPDGLWPMIVTG